MRRSATVVVSSSKSGDKGKAVLYKAKLTNQKMPTPVCKCGKKQ